jgi:hypothetical protein
MTYPAIEASGEVVRLRARVAELETRISVAADQIARLEVERWEFADECATLADPLKPLAKCEIWQGSVISSWITEDHVKAARAALEGEG